MNPRLALALSALIVAVTTVPVLGGIGTAQPASFTYDFETCDQGWTTASASSLPLSPTWERSAPGHDSETAFRLPDYLDLQDESLISPLHPVTGGPVTVSYFVSHDTEDTFDFLYLDWSSDGETWENLKEYTGLNEGHPAFIADSAQLTPPAGNLQIRFRFVSDDFFSSISDGFTGVAVDTVTLPGAGPAEAACPEPSPTTSGDPSPTASPTGSPDPSPSPTSSPSPDPRGCTIFGTEDDDVLKGTKGADVICGYGGDDVINGRGGNDKLFGDKGKDDVKGGPGNDNLKGGGGADRLRGGRGDDKHAGGGGNDTCTDNKGSNRFRSCEKK